MFEDFLDSCHSLLLVLLVVERSEARSSKVWLGFLYFSRLIPSEARITESL